MQVFLRTERNILENFLQKVCRFQNRLYLCNPKTKRLVIRHDFPGMVKGKTNIEIWCNGSTTDSGSVSEGSSPSISTNNIARQYGGIAQLVRAHDS